jgi:hypothetical protein
MLLGFIRFNPRIESNEEAAHAAASLGKSRRLEEPGLGLASPEPPQSPEPRANREPNSPGTIPQRSEQFYTDDADDDTTSP